MLEAGLAPARSEGERLKVKVAPRWWPAPLGKTVHLHPGPARLVGDVLVVAFSWEASRIHSLFPRLDADIEIAAFGLRQTMIVLRGRYEPPSGSLGVYADDLLMHHLAESTVRAFLDGLCANLGRSVVQL